MNLTQDAGAGWFWAMACNHFGSRKYANTCSQAGLSGVIVYASRVPPAGRVDECTSDSNGLCVSGSLGGKVGELRWMQGASVVTCRGTSESPAALALWPQSSLAPYPQRHTSAQRAQHPNAITSTSTKIIYTFIYLYIYILLILTIIYIYIYIWPIRFR